MTRIQARVILDVYNGFMTRHLLVILFLRQRSGDHRYKSVAQTINCYNMND